MDQEQFQQFLSLINQSQQQLITRVLSAQPQGSSQQGTQPLINTTLLPSFENFDAKKESFRYYRQRFENYLQIKGVASDKALCAKMLLNSIGATYYNMLAALVAPQMPTMLEYQNLVEVLEKHLCPKKNILVAQHRFLSTYQNENQSLAEYTALLRRDIADCEFISPCDCKVFIAEIFLRAQFIRGIKDNSIREQLLQSNVSTFKEISEKALALEASKIDSRELSKNQPAVHSFNTEDVNKVIKQQKSRRDTSTSRKRNSEKNPSRHNHRPRSKSRIDYKRLGIEGLCLRCGNNNHLAKDCRIKISSLKCTACSKSGHLSKSISKDNLKLLKLIQEQELHYFHEKNSKSLN
ncbi:uncharacterized protein LOC120360052 [Solenopsis invicta]|uniref:uncharacterized protein LOC120360052 n=1 Tax=Solenopsis invicta TaxID=13686 RepID=UPI00193D9FAA|nr:uncharacterized protein LOC120360052 [Solenopsis invicta]